MQQQVSRNISKTSISAPPGRSNAVLIRLCGLPMFLRRREPRCDGQIVVYSTSIVSFDSPAKPTPATTRL